MAKGRQIPPPIPPEKGIQLLSRQYQKGEELLTNRPLTPEIHHA
jgi:hypothetical protein